MILLMAEILHQLRLVVFPIIYRVSYIPGGPGFQPSTVVFPVDQSVLDLSTSYNEIAVTKVKFYTKVKAQTFSPRPVPAESGCRHTHVCPQEKTSCLMAEMIKVPC